MSLELSWLIESACGRHHDFQGEGAFAKRPSG
jgi:hypothetical protein